MPEALIAWLQAFVSGTTSSSRSSSASAAQQAATASQGRCDVLGRRPCMASATAKGARWLRTKGFVARWSRLKREARERADAAPTTSGTPAPPPPSGPVAARSEARRPSRSRTNRRPSIRHPARPRKPGPRVRLQPVHAKGVPLELRNQALRQLWRSSPVLANLDGLVEYGEDYSGRGTKKMLVHTAYRVGRGFDDRVEELGADKASRKAGRRQRRRGCAAERRSGSGEPPVPRPGRPHPAETAGPTANTARPETRRSAPRRRAGRRPRSEAKALTIRVSSRRSRSKTSMRACCRISKALATGPGGVLDLQVPQSRMSSGSGGRYEVSGMGASSRRPSTRPAGGEGYEPRSTSLLARFLAAPRTHGSARQLAGFEGDDTSSGGRWRAGADRRRGPRPMRPRASTTSCSSASAAASCCPYASYYLTGFLNEKPLARLRQRHGAAGHRARRRGQGARGPHRRAVRDDGRTDHGRVRCAGRSRDAAGVLRPPSRALGGEFFADLERASSACSMRRSARSAGCSWRSSGPRSRWDLRRGACGRSRRSRNGRIDNREGDAMKQGAGGERRQAPRFPEACRARQRGRRRRRGEPAAAGRGQGGAERPSAAGLSRDRARQEGLRAGPVLSARDRARSEPAGSEVGESHVAKEDQRGGNGARLSTGARRAHRQHHRSPDLPAALGADRRRRRRGRRAGRRHGDQGEGAGHRGGRRRRADQDASARTARSAAR